MNTILAALKDLWNFVWGLNQNVSNRKSNQEILLITSPPDLLKLPVSKEIHTLDTAENRNNIAFSNKHADFVGEKYYITASPGPVFNRPVLSYDGVLVNLPYATLTQVVAYEGRFARIILGDSTGWILKDNLTSQAGEIFPDLASGKVYTEDSLETQKLRKYIKDEFFTNELFLPLQSSEYVTYKLKRQGLSIDWPAVRPRLAGIWQNILKGKNGIRIGLVPKTGALIEYNHDDGGGFVGYTVSVRVDESIIIAGVGRHVLGEYREELIEKIQWQSWRPVWISVS